MLTALFLFALGSAISGAASSLNMLIAGRSTSCIPPNSRAPTQIFHPKAIQGLGAGAITASIQIMLSDLVTLRERGTFSGLMALYVLPCFCVSNVTYARQLLGNRWWCWSSHWWVIGSERTMVSVPFATRLLADILNLSTFPIGDGYFVG